MYCTKYNGDNIELNYHLQAWLATYFVIKNISLGLTLEGGPTSSWNRHYKL
jgi:hypothetical protein